jgi:N-acyl-D-amino-acid deacylase
MSTRKRSGESYAHLRGIIALGRRADLNVMDFDRPILKMPRTAYDLPSGGSRLLQESEGYLATMVNGVVTRESDQDTGARPGWLVRLNTAH